MRDEILEDNTGLAKKINQQINVLLIREMPTDGAFNY